VKKKFNWLEIKYLSHTLEGVNKHPSAGGGSFPVRILNMEAEEQYQ